MNKCKECGLDTIKLFEDQCMSCYEPTEAKMSAPKSEVRVWSWHKEDSYAVEGDHGNDKVFDKLMLVSDHLTEVQALKAEIAVLEARLEKCKEQRDWLASHVPVWSSAFNGDISLLDKQLSAITIDSIKRGE